MATLRGVTIAMILTTMVALMLCWYAFYVEMNKHLDDKYQALCDISEHMSCSKAFTSRYGRGFGLIGRVAGDNSAWNQPNPIFGAGVYVTILMLAQVRTVGLAKFQVALCALINFGSLYLGFILYYILHDLCIICVSTYLVNFVLLVLSIKRYRIIKQAADVAQSNLRAAKAQ